VTFSYGVGTAGNTYLWKLRVTDGQTSSESQLAVGVEAPPSDPSGLNFEAEAGVIAAPFIITNGYIYQASQTALTNSGRACYSFSITNAGDYVIIAVVDAPNDAENSLFVNIDAEPQDPYTVWQIPVTTGFETRIVAWQGNGTWDNSQFVPKIFALTQGTHQLIIRGREAGTLLDRFAFVKMLEAPRNLRLVPGR
jgi:hypothetical protein